MGVNYKFVNFGYIIFVNLENCYVASDIEIVLAELKNQVFHKRKEFKVLSY